MFVAAAAAMTPAVGTLPVKHSRLIPGCRVSGAPADAPVDLHEIRTPIHHGTQGAARRQLTEYFALQFLDFGKGIKPGP